MRQIERIARARLAEWDTMLEREGAQTRAILSAALVGRFVFTPGEDEDGRFYEYLGRWSVGGVVAGLICTIGVVTPGGSTEGWSASLGFKVEGVALAA